MLIVVLASCSKLDINVNPVQPVTTEANLRLPAILGNMAYHIYSQARFTSYHSLYLNSRYNSSNNGYTAPLVHWNYTLAQRIGAWRWHYFDVGSNCLGMIERAERDGANNYKGVGKIVLAFSYLTATDVFGDMPYTEAYTGIYYPKYDTQDVVYAGVLSLLNEGIEALNSASSADPVMDSSADLIYGGDINKWKAFAEAVRARLLLHTASFEKNYDEVLAVTNAALAGFSDAMFRYAEAPSRDWETNMWGPDIPRPEWNFADITNVLESSVHTDFFMNYLTVNDPGLKYDPRLLKLTTPGVKGVYNGAMISEGLAVKNWPKDTPVPAMEDFAKLYNGYWTSDNSPQPYILKEELYFIKAEAAFYQNDRNTAFEAYREGIRLNMERLGVSAGEITGYLSSSKVKHDASELTVSDIMGQKYIAMYLQPESWVDMRRYKYSAKAYPGIYYPKNVTSDAAGRWLQRMPYDPQTEPIYNPRELERLGANARNWLFVPVWWAEKSQLN